MERRISIIDDNTYVLKQNKFGFNRVHIDRCEYDDRKFKLPNLIVKQIQLVDQISRLFRGHKAILAGFSKVKVLRQKNLLNMNKFTILTRPRPCRP